MSVFPKTVQDFYRKLVIETMHNRELQKIVRPDMIHLLMEAKKGNSWWQFKVMKVSTSIIYFCKLVIMYNIDVNICSVSIQHDFLNPYNFNILYTFRNTVWTDCIFHTYFLMIVQENWFMTSQATIRTLASPQSKNHP